MSCEADADKKAEKPERALEGSAGSTRVQLQAHQAEPAIGEHSEQLLETVLSRENMLNALRRVVSNGGAPGVDGMKVEDLKAHCLVHWSKIREQLLAGTYQPQAVRRVDIPKPTGGTRMLGIPTVIDRLIQQALHQVLQPLYEETFSPQSYGFRPGRNAQGAVKQAQAYINQEYQWVVDLDLEQFFDRVNHDRLMYKLSLRIKDKRILKLIRRYLESGLMLGGVTTPRQEGVPQGGPLSPLLSNIVLDELDKELEKRDHRHVRYADDCNIYVKSARAGERVLAKVTTFIETRLKLKVNKSKSGVARPWERKFLGYTVTQKGAKLKVAKESIQKLKGKLKDRLRRGRGRRVETLLKELQPVIRGWVNYFKYSEVKGVFEELDSWVRRKIRCIYWRQWKKPRTRKRKLKWLGLSEEYARKAVYSGRGPWRNAGARHMHIALPNQKLRDMGLLSFIDEYRRVASC